MVYIVAIYICSLFSTYHAYVQGHIEGTITWDPPLWFFSDDLKVALHFQADGNFLLKTRVTDEMDSPPFWDCSCFDKIWQSGTANDASDPALTFDGATGKLWIHETSNPSTVYYTNTVDSSSGSKPPFYFTVANSQRAYILNSDNEVVWSTTSINSPHPTLDFPSMFSTDIPTKAPVMPTNAPSLPTNEPSLPTNAPSLPTKAPSLPTEAPSLPTEAPSLPTEAPSLPTNVPSLPSNAPSLPTNAPSLPTNAPVVPTNAPVITTNVPIMATTAATTTTTTDMTSFPPTDAPVSAVTSAKDLLTSQLQSTFTPITSTNPPSNKPTTSTTLTTDMIPATTTTEDPLIDTTNADVIRTSPHSEERPSNYLLSFMEQNIVIVGVVICFVLLLISICIVCGARLMIRRRKEVVYVVEATSPDSASNMASNVKPVESAVVNPGAFTVPQYNNYDATVHISANRYVVPDNRYTRKKMSESDSLYVWDKAAAGTPGTTSPGLETTTGAGVAQGERHGTDDGTSTVQQEGEGCNKYFWVESVLMNCEDDEHERNRYLDNFKKHKIDDQLLQTGLITQLDPIWRELVPEYGVRLKVFRILFG